MDWRVGKFCSIHIGKVSQGDGFLQNQGRGGSGPDSNSDVSVTYCWITAPNLVTKNSFAHDFTCHFSNSTPTMWTGITLSWRGLGSLSVGRWASPKCSRQLPSHFCLPGLFGCDHSAGHGCSSMQPQGIWTSCMVAWAPRQCSKRLELEVA